MCEERVARAWVSIRVLRYMYITIYMRVYIGKNMSEYSVPFSRDPEVLAECAKTPDLVLRPVPADVTVRNHGNIETTV